MLEDGVPDALCGTETRGVATARASDNAVFALGDKLVAKLYRKVDPGLHAETEIGRFLRRHGSVFTAPFVGSLEYEWRDAFGRHHATLGVIHEYVKNRGEAWTHIVEAVRRGVCETGPTNGSDGAAVPYPDLQGFVKQLACKVADLHRILASDPSDVAFAPEPFTGMARRSMYQRIRTLLVSVLDRLLRLKDTFPEDLAASAATLLDGRETLLKHVALLIECRQAGQRIRCHGNLHLGQILQSNDDLVIVDFDGEPGRPLFERRLKRSPLQDVVSLMRSFAYAAVEGERLAGAPGSRTADTVRQWRSGLERQFLAEYRRRMQDCELLPSERGSWQTLLVATWIERTVHELGVELEQRRGWLHVPLDDLLVLLQSGEAAFARGWAD